MSHEVMKVGQVSHLRGTVFINVCESDAILEKFKRVYSRFRWKRSQKENQTEKTNI